MKASGEPSLEPKHAAEELKLATFAFRVKERTRLDEFMEAVEAHKAKAAEVHSVFAGAGAGVARECVGRGDCQTASGITGAYQPSINTIANCIAAPTRLPCLRWQSKMQEHHDRLAVLTVSCCAHRCRTSRTCLKVERILHGHAAVTVTLCCWTMTLCGKQSASKKRFSTLSVLC